MQNSGLENMIDMDQIDNLARLYRLFSSVPTGLPNLRRFLKDSIERRGKELNGNSGDDDGDAKDDEDGFVMVDNDPKGKGKARVAAASIDDASKWVEGVLRLKDKFDYIWEKAFDADRQIETSLNEVRVFSFSLEQSELTEWVGIGKFHQSQPACARIYIAIY